ncbi:hypothetical protein A0118_RS13690 [Acinetobacter baumannii]|uniref:hypothetical protein n=1 Tax=Acinetobacter baumannii TaxID=470 RepID=UPI000D646CAC|nr:hypothetical protein [Acinetobacter baumannii]EHU1614137.1 hypothetical protein [Acinetobacter baumannii]EHU2314311.1 hypothetical protein [Acinetobacter baumannii]EHU2485695.1 hypothetical protein [Acinetobacter baumannii]EHU2521803.1 hypothetical protein [Acinetobacter baumannii]
MYYVSYKTTGHPVFIGKLKEGEPTGKPFVVYKSYDGLLVGDENYLYDEANNILRWEGLLLPEYEREIVGFADTEDEAFIIGNAV